MLRLIIFTLSFAYITLAAPHEEVSTGGRIIGGNDTIIINYPYQVSVESGQKLYCGGTIIARTWILTAAACFDWTANPLVYQVRIGTSYTGVGGQLLNVTQVILHTDYNYDKVDYNIALIQLQSPISLSRSAQIINLPNKGQELEEGIVGNITGWGYTESGQLSTILQAAQVPIISQSVCKGLYSTAGYAGYVTENMFCAGYWNGGIDACDKDGGGPLVIDNTLYGIISWGLGCAKAQLPGVYTNVGVFRDWITEHTGI